MRRKSISNTILAALIVAGSLGLTANEAAASHKKNNGPRFFISIGIGHKVCDPKFKKVVWWDKKGHKHVDKIYVGKKCHWEPIIIGF